LESTRRRAMPPALTDVIDALAAVAVADLRQDGTI
jgi:hypothetical protein